MKFAQQNNTQTVCFADFADEEMNKDVE